MNSNGISASSGGNIFRSNTSNIVRQGQNTREADLNLLVNNLFEQLNEVQQRDEIFANVEFLDKIRIAIETGKPLKPLIDGFTFAPENLPKPTYSLLQIAIQNFSDEGVKLFCDLKCAHINRIVSIIFESMSNDVKNEDTSAIARYQLFILRILQQNSQIYPQDFCKYYLHAYNASKNYDIDVHICPILQSINESYEIDQSSLITGMSLEMLGELSYSGKLKWLPVDENLVNTRICELRPKPEQCIVQ